jgi:opacity protein-like surface antigen
MAAGEPAPRGEQYTDGEPAPLAGAAGQAADDDKPAVTSPDGSAGGERGDDEDDFEDDFEDDANQEHDGSEEQPPVGPPPPVTGPPRPEPLPEIETPEAPPWQRHLEVGGGVVYVSRPLFGDRPSTSPRYQAGVGFGVDLRWDLFSFLRIHPYFLHVVHHTPMPRGALTTEADNSISGATVFPETSAATFSFGARVEPVWALNERLRAWLSVGVGWGRLRVPVQGAFDPALGGDPEQPNLFLPDRAFSFVEFPLGIGTGFDIIERWLALNYDLAVVPVVGQSGDAVEPFQGIDGSGQTRDIAALEAFDVYFAHSLTLALIL